jgi:hypothetical protein
MDGEMKCLLSHASPIATPETPVKKRTARTRCPLNANLQRAFVKSMKDEMKAVRLLVVVSITHRRRFSSPSINHYKIPIQEEKAYVARGNGRSGWNSRMQQDYKGSDVSAGRELFSGTAAENIHQLLHCAGLLRLLLPGLLRLRARRWCCTVGRSQIRLAVLELGLGGSSLGCSQFSHALPLNLGLPLCGVSWASSWLGSSRSGLGKRLV